MLETKATPNAVSKNSDVGYKAPEIVPVVNTTENISEPQIFAKNVSFSAIQNDLNDSVRVRMTNPLAMSVDSAASVDGESDIDDVPDAFGDDATFSGKNRWEKFSLKFNLAEFFKSPQYRLTSLIFGPMVCFFIVA